MLDGTLLKQLLNLLLKLLLVLKEDATLQRVAFFYTIVQFINSIIGCYYGVVMIYLYRSFNYLNKCSLVIDNKVFILMINLITKNDHLPLMREFPRIREALDLI